MVTQNDKPARRVEGVINLSDYEAIGRLARNYYVAEVERVNARIARAKARNSHKCVVESKDYKDDTGASEHFCYNQYVRNPTPFEEWCENCKYVQPYHLAYREAAKKAQAARYSMTRAIQRKMLSEAEE